MDSHEGKSQQEEPGGSSRLLGRFGAKWARAQSRADWLFELRNDKEEHINNLTSRQRNNILTVVFDE